MIIIITIVQLLLFSILYPVVVIKKPQLLFILTVLVSPSYVLFENDFVVLKQPLSILIILITYISLILFSRKFQRIHLTKPLSSILKYVIAINIVTIISSLMNSLIFDSGAWYSHREFMLMLVSFFCFLALIYHVTLDLDNLFFHKSLAKLCYFFHR